MKAFFMKCLGWGVAIVAVGYLVGGTPLAQKASQTVFGGYGAVSGAVVGGAPAFKAGWEATAPNGGVLGDVTAPPAQPDNSGVQPAGATTP